MRVLLYSGFKASCVPYVLKYTLTLRPRETGSRTRSPLTLSASTLPHAYAYAYTYLAGGTQLAENMRLKLPDGTSRCQGMVGITTQCPNGLDCSEHADVNEVLPN
jgi:hypothetical protein